MEIDLKHQAFIFGSIFLLANKLQVVCDKYLEKDGLTTKQWFLIAAIMNFKDTPATLSEVADKIGSSRQNVKQLALKLEKNEFLRMEKDDKDSRAVRLILTDKCHKYWKEREQEDIQFISILFQYLSKDELETVSESIVKLMKSIDEDC